ncbi:MAG: response regulator [Gammaproteobacteria bacterium]
MTTAFEELFILLVEPSGAQAKIIGKQFAGLGITNYKWLTTGTDALDSLSKSEPDLMISAMYLPDMTGAELVNSIRMNDANRDLVFMLISTETCFYQLEPVRQAGATAILPKPFSAQELKKALLTTLDFLDIEQLRLDNFDPEKLNVLVVDDSKFARSQIIRTLQMMGIENFYQATDGRDAMPVIDNNYVDLVVTDYNMPEVDGKALIEYIRNESKQAAVPILMVTSEGNMNKLAAVEQSGVSAICDKPFEPKTVKGMIEAIMAA